MAQTTITEALAELKTLTSRIAKKREHSSHYILRDNRAVDPLISEGGSEAFVDREWQAVRDLESRFIAIRRAIAEANLKTSITIGDFTLCITDWLTWRRDIAPARVAYLRNIHASIQRARKEAQNLVNKTENNPPGMLPPALLININEASLMKTMETVDQTLSELDGKLSLINATTTIDI